MFEHVFNDKPSIYKTFTKLEKITSIGKLFVLLYKSFGKSYPNSKFTFIVEIKYLAVEGGWESPYLIFALSMSPNPI